MFTRLLLALLLVVPAQAATSMRQSPTSRPRLPVLHGPRIHRTVIPAKAGIQIATAQAPANAQSTVSVSDPTAVALASRALQSLAGGTALNDITLQGSATYVAGSDEETGTATLVARGNAQSLVTLNLTGGQRQEVRNGPAGYWSGPDGTQYAMAPHNCWIRGPLVLSRSGPPGPVGRPDRDSAVSWRGRMERRGGDPSAVIPHRARSDTGNDRRDPGPQRR